MKLKKFKLPKPGRKTIVAVLFLAGIAGLLYYFKNRLIIAWVNGQPVTRAAYVRELEKIAQTQALDSLLTKDLIVQEAKKQNVSVEPAEVDEAMKAIDDRAKEQGSSLDELLAAQGLNRAEIEEEVKLQRQLEKMAGEITVSEDEINTYWEENEALFPDQTLEEVRGEIEEQIKQNGLMNKMQELIARLQTEAKIVKWL